MNLIQRVKNKMFKCNISSVIDYHAGGFFIYKKVDYLIFSDTNTMQLFSRTEGNHPFDNNIEWILEDLAKDKEVLAFEIDQPNNNTNILRIRNRDREILLMPAIFSENVNKEVLSEVILDKFYDEPKIFTSVK